METKDQITELRERYFIHLTGVAQPSQVSEMEKVIINNSFDFFWKEIEKLQASEDELCLKVQKEQDEAVRIYNEGEERDKIRLDKISRLESTLESAEEVIKAADQIKVNTKYTEEIKNFLVAVSKYNQLKSNQQSPNS